MFQVNFVLVARLTLFLLLATPAPFVSPVQGDHGVLLQGNGRLVILSPQGAIEWERPWGPIHDCHLLPSGNLLVLEGKSKVTEIDRETKATLWTFDAATIGGDHDPAVEVHACQPLEDDRVMIAVSSKRVVIEVNREGDVVKSIPLRVDHPHPHTDTRLVRKILSGNYLACHEGDGVVREYDGETGAVVWEYKVPLFGKEPREGHGPEAFGNKVFAAVRLANGNTLISTGNGHSVLEVNPAKEIVWQLAQNDLPGITLAWVTTLEVLDNGNYVIGNCHAGPGNPLLVEIEPKTKRVAWTLDRFADFGNSVSNSQIVGLQEPSIR